MITVKQIGEREYRISGNYAGEFDFDENFDLGENKRSPRWENLVLCDLEFIGIEPVVFWDFNFCHYEKANEYAFSGGRYSQVRTINIYAGLEQDFKTFGSDISLFSKKNNYGSRWCEELFFEHGAFEVPIFEYGFGHGFFAEIDAIRFLDMDFLNRHSIKRAYRNLVPGIEKVKKTIPEDQKFNLAHHLISLLTERKKYDQQSTFRARLRANGFAC